MERQGAARLANAMQVQTGAEKQSGPAQTSLSSLLINGPQHRAQDALVQPRVGQQQFEEDALPILLHRAPIIALQAIKLNLMCTPSRLYMAQPENRRHLRQISIQCPFMLVGCCLCQRLLQLDFRSAISASVLSAWPLQGPATSLAAFQAVHDRQHVRNETRLATRSAVSPSVNMPGLHRAQPPAL